MIRLQARWLVVGLVGWICSSIGCGNKKEPDDLEFLSKFKYTKSVADSDGYELVTYRILGDHAAIFNAVPGAGSASVEVEPGVKLYHLRINGHPTVLLVPDNHNSCLLQVQTKP